MRTTQLRPSLTLSLWWRVTSPLVGSSCPVTSRRSVVFPAPLGPTTATLVSVSTRKRRSSNSGDWGALGQAKDASRTETEGVESTGDLIY